MKSSHKTPLTQQTRIIRTEPLQLSDSSSIPLISFTNMGRSCCKSKPVRTQAEPGQMIRALCLMLTMLSVSAGTAYVMLSNIFEPIPYDPRTPSAPSLSPSSSLPGNHSNLTFTPSSSSLPFSNASNSSTGPSPSHFSPSSSLPYPPETDSSAITYALLIMGLGLVNLPIILNVMRLAQLQIRQRNFNILQQHEGISFDALNNILSNEHSIETLSKFIQFILEEYNPSQCCTSTSSSKLYTQLKNTHSESDIIPTMNAVTHYCYKKGSQGKKMFSAINAAANRIQAETPYFAAP